MRPISLHVKSKKFKQTKIKPTDNEVASTGYKWVEVAPLRRRPVCVRRETEVLKGPGYR